MKKIKYQDETYTIIGLCMEVHNELGPGLLEIIYKDALEYEFKLNNVPYEREKKYIVPYKDTILKREFYADFTVYAVIILEAKAVSTIVNDHIARTLNYMKLAKSLVGLLVNFGSSSLEHKRLVF